MQDGKARRNELICDAFFCLDKRIQGCIAVSSITGNLLHAQNGRVSSNTRYDMFPDYTEDTNGRTLVKT